MTIHNEPTQKLPMPMSNITEQEDDEDDTPPRVPVVSVQRPSMQAIWAVPTHPLPIITIPAQRQQPPAPILPPPSITITKTQRPKRRRLAIPIVITLVLLALLITLTGIFGRNLFNGTDTSAQP